MGEKHKKILKKKKKLKWATVEGVKKKKKENLQQPFTKCRTDSFGFALKGNSGIFKPRPYFWHEIRAAAARVDDVIPVDECVETLYKPPTAANNNNTAAMS